MVELVYKLDEKSITSAEKVSQSLKYTSNLFWGSHTYNIYIYVLYINGNYENKDLETYIPTEHTHSYT